MFLPNRQEWKLTTIALNCNRNRHEKNKQGKPSEIQAYGKLMGTRYNDGTAARSPVIRPHQSSQVEAQHTFNHILRGHDNPYDRSPPYRATSG